MDQNKQNQNDRNNKNRRNVRGIASLLLWALALTMIYNYALEALSTTNRAAASCEVRYDEFVDLLQEGKLELVEIGDRVIEFYPVEGFVYTAADGTEYRSNYVLYTSIISNPDLVAMLEESNVQYTRPYEAEASVLSIILWQYIVPMALMIGGLVLMMRIVSKKTGGGMGGFGMGSVGKSNAKVYMEKSTGVTFADVAGQDEAKESLEEIIDFLHNPDKYTAIGAKLPKGALLVGSPGTGKTLLAKAVAGEANVPFFSISGSGFVEMFVGVGASRVRDLFQEAAKVAPCIIFIDEIDAIGKTRDTRFGGNDEREQTLNQLLAEMDGFDPSKGIIVLAATNRPEVLDKALLRPGRFDRRITVDRPNLAGRLKTLEVHTRGIHLAEDVDLEKIAQATAGCVGADLANLVNEAALRAVRKGRKAVNQEDLLVSFEVVIAGAEKKGTVITEPEKRMIAYHEVGHALVAHAQKDNAMPVSKITIVPHTQGALGYTLHLPEEEKFLMTEEDILAEIRTLLGGRSAEELVFSSRSSGAANDIERATELARNLVTRFGMCDEFDMVALGSASNQYLDGTYSMSCAQETFAAADRAVIRIIRQCHAEAREILEKERENLDKVAAYLLKKETITGQEMLAILEGRDPESVDNYGLRHAQQDGFRPSVPNGIEAPARHISMESRKIEAPADDAPTEDAPTDDAPTGEPGDMPPQE